MTATEFWWLIERGQAVGHMAMEAEELKASATANDQGRTPSRDRPNEGVSPGTSSSDRLDPCYGAGSQEPPQAPSRDGIPLSGREPGSEIEAGQVRNCDSPGTVGRSVEGAIAETDRSLVALGDAVTVNVAEWIGGRLAA